MTPMPIKKPGCCHPGLLVHDSLVVRWDSASQNGELAYLKGSLTFA